jgi:hypothetical protein
MYDLLWELTVKLITIWWLQKLGKFGNNKPSAQKFNVERFNLRELSELEVRKQYHIKVLNNSEDINRAWELIKETTKFSAKESRSVRIEAA